jgi:hypothetical protein
VTTAATEITKLPPELREYAAKMGRHARVERRCLRALVARAKDDKCSLHQAAIRIVSALPKKEREKALRAIDLVIEGYRRKVVDRAVTRAMNPRHPKRAKR